SECLEQCPAKRRIQRFARANRLRHALGISRKRRMTSLFPERMEPASALAGSSGQRAVKLRPRARSVTKYRPAIAATPAATRRKAPNGQKRQSTSWTNWLDRLDKWV